jgi:hypothetical protein
MVDRSDVDERLRAWRPTQQEVDEIVRSLRPLLRELAHREQEKIAAEILRRRRDLEVRARAATTHVA